MNAPYIMKFQIRVAIIFTTLLLGINAVNGLAQQSTHVVVRAIAKDAMFIGSSMGGAMVTIKNAETGELLAKGKTKGSTGDTQKLIKEPHKRYEKLSTDGAAKFEAELQLQKPIFVTVQAKGPQDSPQAEAMSSTQLWLIPGKDIAGDGIILEIPGFVVDVVSPKKQTTAESKELSIKAKVVMMCGCPTSDGGLWDSSEFEIKALIKKNGDEIKGIPLHYTGEKSSFSGKWLPENAGNYEITVYVFDPRTGNSGVDRTSVVVK